MRSGRESYYGRARSQWRCRRRGARWRWPRGVGGTAQQRAPAARAYQRPHREQQGGKADGEGYADDRHASRSISRRMRSRIASVGGAAAAAEGRRRVQRVTRMPTMASPTATAIPGMSQTRRLNPWRRGASRIHSPYLSTKYWTTWSGRSPVARRSRITARIWEAISDGESATERFWQTTQRS